MSTSEHAGTSWLGHALMRPSTHGKGASERAAPRRWASPRVSGSAATQLGQVRPGQRSPSAGNRLLWNDAGKSLRAVFPGGAGSRTRHRRSGDTSRPVAACRRDRLRPPRPPGASSPHRTDRGRGAGRRPPEAPPGQPSPQQGSPGSPAVTDVTERHLLPREPTLSAKTLMWMPHSYLAPHKAVTRSMISSRCRSGGRYRRAERGRLPALDPWAGTAARRTGDGPLGGGMDQPLI